MDKELILKIHGIIGIVIFATGLLQFVLKKGGSRHIIIGRVYMFSWIILLVTGAYLGGALITTIGIFGFYYTLTGSRIGHLKTKEMTLFEKAVFCIGGLVALTMLYHSATLFLKDQNSFAIIFAVFGALFLFTTAEDIAKYIIKKPLRKQKYGKSDWYFEHIVRMCISFIAAVTAFTSIQNVFGNNTLNFLVPTVLGIVLIKIVTNSYKNKLLK